MPRKVLVGAHRDSIRKSKDPTLAGVGVPRLPPYRWQARRGGEGRDSVGKLQWFGEPLALIISAWDQRETSISLRA